MLDVVQRKIQSGWSVLINLAAFGVDTTGVVRCPSADASDLGIRRSSWIQLPEWREADQPRGIIFCSFAEPAHCYLNGGRRMNENLRDFVINDRAVGPAIGPAVAAASTTATTGDVSTALKIKLNNNYKAVE